MSLLIFLSLSAPQFWSYKITLLYIFSPTCMARSSGWGFSSINAGCRAASPVAVGGQRVLHDILEFLYFENMSLALDCEAGAALNAHVTPTANFLWSIWDFSFNLEILLVFGSAGREVLRLNKLNSS